MNTPFYGILRDASDTKHRMFVQFRMDTVHPNGTKRENREKEKLKTDIDKVAQ